MDGLHNASSTKNTTMQQVMEENVWIVTETELVDIVNDVYLTTSCPQIKMNMDEFHVNLVTVIQLVRFFKLWIWV